MNLAKIQQDIANAQQDFDYVEAHPTDTGRLMALVALETSRRVYILSITFPYTYPSAMPDVFRSETRPRTFASPIST